MKLGEINIAIHQDKEGNLTYLIINSNERGVTACYNGNTAINHIKEQFAKIILK